MATIPTLPSNEFDESVSHHLLTAAGDLYGVYVNVFLETKEVPVFAE